MKTRVVFWTVVVFGFVVFEVYALSASLWLMNQPDDLAVVAGAFGLTLACLVLALTVFCVAGTAALMKGPK